MPLREMAIDLKLTWSLLEQNRERTNKKSEQLFMLFAFNTKNNTL